MSPITSTLPDASWAIWSGVGLTGLFRSSWVFRSEDRHARHPLTGTAVMRDQLPVADQHREQGALSTIVLVLGLEASRQALGNIAAK
jgi:hypothetical protein